MQRTYGSHVLLPKDEHCLVYAAEWQTVLQVSLLQVSTVCVPLKVLDDGGAQALLLVQATSKRRDGEFRSSSNNPFKERGTRYQLPGLLLAFQHLLLVLAEEVRALHVGALEHLPAAELRLRDVCDWHLCSPQTPSDGVPSRASRACVLWTPCHRALLR